MKLKRISARTLLQYCTAELYNTLTGRFIIVFDDGEIETNWRSAVYSSYAWDFHRMYPATPILKAHFVDSFLKGGRLQSDTHLKLLGACMWAAFDAVHPTVGGNPQVLIDQMAKLLYQKTNEMFVELSELGEEYVTSLSILDFYDVVRHPVILAAKKALPENFSREELSSVQDLVMTTLTKDDTLRENAISRAVRSKLASQGQVLQCIGPRGFVTDIDSHYFRTPIRPGFAEGIRLFHDSLIESRSASKALEFSKAPLQDAEYFSRRLQFVCQKVKNLHFTDCGSTTYLHWHVRGKTVDPLTGEILTPDDLPTLAGKVRVDSEGKYREILATDTHLIGKTVRLRSPIHCKHPDPYGICSVCFGALSYSVPEKTNIGQMCGTSMAQKTSQSVLSVKHLDGSSTVDRIYIDDIQKKYFTISDDGSSYLLNPALAKHEVKFIIPPEHTANLTDVFEVKRVEELNISRVSEMAAISLRVTIDKTEYSFDMETRIGRRFASMTHDMLRHLRKKHYTISDRGAYEIDMKEWDYSRPVLTLPLKHYNMSDHSKAIEVLLESSVNESRDRFFERTPDDLLVEFYDLVNSKLNANLAVLEVVLYAYMITSLEDKNYHLPKGDQVGGLGVMELIMSNGSLGAKMAYEGHRKVIVDPEMYLREFVPDHPMDMILCPELANPK